MDSISDKTCPFFTIGPDLESQMLRMGGSRTKFHVQRLEQGGHPLNIPFKTAVSNTFDENPIVQ